MKTSAQDSAAAVLEAVPAAMRVIRKYMRSHRLPGMSVPQFRILGFLERNGPTTLSAVAEHLGISLPSTSRMVQSLVEKKLALRRTGVPDRRTVRLQITAKGSRIRETARRATIQQLAERIGGLSADEMARLQKGMGLLLRVIPHDDCLRHPPGTKPRC